jgi:CBS domain containing-hemolysin-like protein
MPLLAIDLTDAPELWLWIGLAISVVLSGLFSGTETGLYSLNRLRLALRDERGGDSRATLLASLMRRRELLLCVFLLGNNVANAAAAMITESFAAEYFEGSMSTVVTMVVLTPVLFLVSEALPKHLFLQHAETWTYRLAGFLRAARILLWPLVVLVLPLARLASNWARQRERRPDLEAEAQQLEGLLVAGGEAMPTNLRKTVLGIGTRQTRPVTEVMTPVSRAVYLSSEAGLDELREAIGLTAYRRFPLREPDGEFRTYVYFLDVFRQNSETPDLSAVARPLVRLEATSQLDDALVSLEVADARVGVVIDEDGTALGFVRVSDLVEGLIALVA